MKYLKSHKADEQEIHRLGAQTRALPQGLQSLVSYWLQKCDGRAMPARDALPVQELRPWLGNLALIERAGDQTYRVRLCGTNLIRRFGRDATGVGVDELAFDIAQQLRAVLKATNKAVAPVVAVSSVQLGRITTFYCEVALPLSGVGAPVATVLLGCYPIRET